MTERIAGFDVEHLHGPEKISYAENELVVVCLERDGLPWVKSFVEHYSSLGAKHLVFLDNGSTDGTVEALKSHENVTVLRTAAPFRQNEGNMRRYLIDRFGEGRWCLCVDMDELFDYPYSDVVSLDSLLGYLNSKSWFCRFLGETMHPRPGPPPERSSSCEHPRFEQIEPRPTVALPLQ